MPFLLSKESGQSHSRESRSFIGYTDERSASMAVDALRTLAQPIAFVLIPPSSVVPKGFGYFIKVNACHDALSNG